MIVKSTMYHTPSERDGKRERVQNGLHKTFIVYVRCRFIVTYDLRTIVRINLILYEDTSFSFGHNSTI